MSGKAAATKQRDEFVENPKELLLARHSERSEESLFEFNSKIKPRWRSERFPSCHSEHSEESLPNSFLAGNQD